MTPGPLDVETDPRFPSGKWVGYWLQVGVHGGKLTQELLLTFRAGTLEGTGRDFVGRFLVRGSYSTEDGRCRWTKKYVGKHDVFYQGFNEGKGIWGTWEIPSSKLKGGFHIWPEEMGDPTEHSLKAAIDEPVGEVVGIA